VMKHEFCISKLVDHEDIKRRQIIIDGDYIYVWVKMSERRCRV